MCFSAPSTSRSGVPALGKSTLLKPTRIYVLYHAHCADGFGAAFAAWCAFGSHGTISYIPVTHGEPLPEIADGALVYILDFSYPREVLVELAGRVTLRVIDHHKTAAAALAGLDFATFDMTKSGAVLAWEYFQSMGLVEGEVPTLLSYVQDRDLWTWEMVESREVSAALAMRPRTFDEWHSIVEDHLGITHLRTAGRLLWPYQQTLVRSMADRAEEGMVAGFPVPVANATTLKDEVCEELMRRHPDAPFVATYFQKAGLTLWSLRSDGTFDVSNLARSYAGGGGHAQAAGFAEPRQKPNV